LQPPRCSHNPTAQERNEGKKEESGKDNVETTCGKENWSGGKGKRKPKR